ncbi:MAG TPA: oligosaccharide flippase family protein [Polyangiaceae bacterium]|nr:oligosaccharide flippase family protein [Polyangiaceae bacterium]
MDGQLQIRRGMLWLGSATIIARLLDVGATIAVLRLLTQEQMGLAALALSACTVLESLSGFGIGHAIIQDRNLSSDEEHSLFWLTSVMGVVLALLLVGLAPLLSSTYDDAALRPLLAVSGLKLVLIGMTVVPLQLLGRTLQFKETGAVQTLASAGEGIVKIVLAALGSGAWAMIWGNVARGLVLLIGLWFLSAYRPRMHFAFAETRRFVRFGLTLASSNILFQMYKNSDYFLVGKFLGLEALGLYRVAFDVAMQPTEAIITVVNRVGLPIYARLAHDTRALLSSFLSTTRSFLLMAAPVAAVIFFASGDVLRIVGGERWLGSQPAVQILVWASLIRAAAVIFPEVYIAAGKPQYATLDSLVSLIVLAGSFACGLHFFPQLGVLSVCLAWLLVYPLILLGHVVWTHRWMSLGVGRYFSALAPGLGAAATMIVGLQAVRRVLPVHQQGLTELLALASLGVVIYLAYLRWILKTRLSEFLPRRGARSGS